MPQCLSHEELRQLVDGELPPEAVHEAEAHLINCAVCFGQWEAMNSEVALQLKMMAAAKPPSGLLFEYHRALKRRFPTASLWQRLFAGVKAANGDTNYLNRTISFALLFLFIAFAATMLFNRPGTDEEIPIAAAVPQSISYQEMMSVSAFLLENEMLLLELSNISTLEMAFSDNGEFVQQLAKELAGRSILIQKKAIEWNDLSLLRLISSLDVLLVELANAEPEELVQRAGFIREVVQEMDLLSQIRLAIDAAAHPERPRMSI